MVERRNPQQKARYQHLGRETGVMRYHSHGQLTAILDEPECEMFQTLANGTSLHDDAFAEVADLGEVCARINYSRAGMGLTCADAVWYASVLISALLGLPGEAGLGASQTGAGTRLKGMAQSREKTDRLTQNPMTIDPPARGDSTATARGRLHHPARQGLARGLAPLPLFSVRTRLC